MFYALIIIAVLDSRHGHIHSYNYTGDICADYTYCSKACCNEDMKRLAKVLKPKKHVHFYVSCVLKPTELPKNLFDSKKPDDD